MAAAPPRPSLAGFLLKKGEGRLLGGGWKRRYFALRGRELQYAAAEGDPPRGAIDLAGASVVTIGRTGLAIEGPNVRRRYEVEASSPEERDRWWAALQMAAAPTPAPAPAGGATPAAVPPEPELQPAPPPREALSADRLPATPTTAAERDRQANLAELFSIVQTLEHLERLYVRDAVPAAQYDAQCQQLLMKFKLQLPLVAEDAPSLPHFLQRYRLVAPAAQHRLSTGLTALSEHGAGRDHDAAGGAGRRVQLVFEVGQHFVTLMDSLNLHQHATDQLQPLLTDVNEGLLRLGQAHLAGRELLVQWLGKLNGMRASEELTDAEARQLLFDVQKVYAEFHRALQSLQ